MKFPILFSGFRPVLWPKNLFEHVLVFGGTGSGKSSGPLKHLLYKSMALGHGMLIHTTKVDDAHDYQKLAKRAGCSPRVEVLNLQNHTFNFLQYLADMGLYDMDIAKMLFRLYDLIAGDGASVERYWTSLADEFLTNLIGAIRLSNRPLNIQMIAGFAHGVQMSNDPDVFPKTEAYNILRDLEDGLIEPNPGQSFEEAQRRAMHIVTSLIESHQMMPEKTRGTVHTVLGTILNFLLQPPLCRVFATEQSTKTPEMIFKNRKIVVLDAPLSLNPQVSRVFQVIWQQAFHFRCQQQARSEAKPTVWVCDEFQAFAHRDIGRLLSILRSFKCSCILATQIYSNLVAEVGKAAAESIVGNPQTFIFCGNLDAQTNDLAVHMAGRDIPKDAKPGVTREVPLLRGANLRNLKSGGWPWYRVEAYVIKRRGFYKVGFRQKLAEWHIPFSVQMLAALGCFWLVFGRTITSQTGVLAAKVSSIVLEALMFP